MNQLNDPTRNLAEFENAIRLHLAAEDSTDHGTLDGTAAYVDQVLELPAVTTAEHAAKLRLLLLTDGEGMDPIVRRALEQLFEHLKRLDLS